MVVFREASEVWVRIQCLPALESGELEGARVLFSVGCMDVWLEFWKGETCGGLMGVPMRYKGVK